MPDTLSVALRSLSFIALFQAAGMAVFLALFGRLLTESSAPIRRIARVSAMAAVALVISQYLLEAARMADAMSGILDASLQRLVLNSASGAVLVVRTLGLSVVAFAVIRPGATGAAISIIGAALVAASFVLIGHTVANPLRWALLPLLLVHVTIVAFWFGALWPLYLASARETPVVAADLTAAFSRIAARFVPLILVAGTLLGFILIKHVAELCSGYGLSLLVKVAGFTVLMGFAVANKWRLGPAIASGDPRALRAFRRSLSFEYVLICLVLSVTAIMTTFYSPEP